MSMELQQQILKDIAVERIHQLEQHGPQSHPGVPVDHRGPADAARSLGIPEAMVARSWCDHRMASGEVTWGDILIEEVAEAIEAAAMGDVEELRLELIQSAAVIVAWVEDLDANG